MSEENKKLKLELQTCQTLVEQETFTRWARNSQQIGPRKVIESKISSPSEDQSLYSKLH